MVSLRASILSVSPSSVICEVLYIGVLAMLSCIFASLSVARFNLSELMVDSIADTSKTAVNPTNTLVKMIKSISYINLAM